jgi:hypothetical protein
MLDRLDSRRRLAELKAARDARRRQRLKSGKACYTIEADGELLDLLVRLHWISEAELLDKRAVERALGEMLAASART